MLILMCRRHLEAPAQQGRSTPLAVRDLSRITGSPSNFRLLHASIARPEHLMYVGSVTIGSQFMCGSESCGFIVPLHWVPCCRRDQW